MIPDRDNQKANREKEGSAGARPADFDPDLSRQRYVFERFSDQLKNWRGIAARTDKTARNYRAGVLIAATSTWLQTDGSIPP